MGGLAVGNAAIGRLGAPAATLPMYAALEAVVAVAGVLGAEIFLIDRVGVLGTAWVAATLDLGAAAGALALAHTRSTSNIDRIAIQSTSNVERIPIGRRTALLAAAFLGGAAFLI